MEITDKKKKEADYDRFIDFMAQMYLKYGAKYKKLTKEELMQLFPEHQCGRKGA